MRRLIISIIAGFAGLFAAAPSASAHGPYPYGTVDTGCGDYAFNQPVQVLWGSSWWEATVVAAQGSSTLIHYVGWPSSWDEWVDPSRVRVVVPLGYAPPAPVRPAYVVSGTTDAYVWSLPRNEPTVRYESRWSHSRRAVRTYRVGYSR